MNRQVNTYVRATALVTLMILLSAGRLFAQGSSFTYQGRLQDGGAAANGSYDFQFTLWDAMSGGTQQPPPSPITVTRTSVQVASGVFTTQLDFGANAFPGANRYLEISVRLAGSGPFTILTPRQQITGVPYAIRSTSAGMADTATTASNATNATNSSQLGGVAASQYVLTTDSRLSDQRPPAPGSVNYIQNTTSQQTGNFNISGNGTIGNNLTVNGPFMDLASSIRKGGTLFLHNLGNDNTGTGMAALNSNTTGTQNAAFGTCALCDNTTGGGNAAFGRYALTSNVSGQENVAVGGDALFANNGDGNVGIGSQTLNNNGSGGLNVAVGTRALYNTTNTQRSVAVGAGALYFSNGGNDNIAIGYESGKWLGSGSNNLMIGNGGAGADANTIRIGGSQTATYIAGIRDANAGGNTVYVDANGRLSSLTSSLRSKQNIRNLGGTTKTLMALRPVRFRYRAQGSAGPEYYGLIAEEVFEVAPELVGRDRDGQIDSVAYDKINVMLLNEVQKQHQVIEVQKKQLRQLERRLKNLENRRSQTGGIRSPLRRQS